jgi:hypothetical protein
VEETGLAPVIQHALALPSRTRGREYRTVIAREGETNIETDPPGQCYPLFLLLEEGLSSAQDALVHRNDFASVGTAAGAFQRRVSDWSGLVRLPAGRPRQVKRGSGRAGDAGPSVMESFVGGRIRNRDKLTSLPGAITLLGDVRLEMSA